MQRLNQSREIISPGANSNGAQDAPRVAEQVPWQNKEYQLEDLSGGRARRDRKQPSERGKEESLQSRPETFTCFWRTVRNSHVTTLYHHPVHTHVLSIYVHIQVYTRVCMCLHILKLFLIILSYNTTWNALKFFIQLYLIWYFLKCGLRPTNMIL